MEERPCPWQASLFRSTVCTIIYKHIASVMTGNPNRFYVYMYLRAVDSAVAAKYTPYYVGKGCGSRSISNQGRRIKMPADKSLIVYVEEGLTEARAFELEKYCIALYGRIDKGTGILRNLTDGGDGHSGYIPTEEMRAKISAANKGRYIGRKVSDETRAKISKATKGDQNPRWNKPVSIETRAKMSQAKKGRKQSREAVQNNIESRSRYLYEIVDPSSNVYLTKNLSGFARDHGLTPQLLRLVAIGRQTHHKGWKVQILEQLK